MNHGPTSEISKIALEPPFSPPVRTPDSDSSQPITPPDVPYKPYEKNPGASERSYAPFEKTSDEPPPSYEPYKDI